MPRRKNWKRAFRFVRVEKAQSADLVDSHPPQVTQAQTNQLSGQFSRKESADAASDEEDPLEWPREKADSLRGRVAFVAGADKGEGMGDSFPPYTGGEWTGERSASTAASPDPPCLPPPLASAAALSHTNVSSAIDWLRADPRWLAIASRVYRTPASRPYRRRRTPPPRRRHQKIAEPKRESLVRHTTPE